MESADRLEEEKDIIQDSETQMTEAHIGGGGQIGVRPPPQANFRPFATPLSIVYVRVKTHICRITDKQEIS